MKRLRQTVWIASDGTSFLDREAAFRHEKILLVADFIVGRSGLHPHEAEGLATSLVDARDQGFQFLILPHRTKEQSNDPHP